MTMGGQQAPTEPSPDGRPGTSRRSGWVAAGIVLLGVVAATVMFGLGLWQAQVSRHGGQAAAAELTAMPVVTMNPAIAGDQTGTSWGRTVTASGHYLDQEFRVVDSQGTRILTAFLLDDGRVLPIVRGTGVSVPPPSGTLVQTGVFLPTEGDADHAVAAGELGSVRLQTVAQYWPQRLVPGYLTLDAADAQAQGMTPAVVVLPTLDGTVRNSGYALQWWAFGTFALVMTGVWARTYWRRGASLSSTL